MEAPECPFTTNDMRRRQCSLAGAIRPSSPVTFTHRPSYLLTTTASTLYAPSKHSRSSKCWRFCLDALVGCSWRRGLSWSWATVGRTGLQATKRQVDAGLGALLAPQAASSLVVAWCWMLVTAGAGAAPALWCFVPRGCSKRWSRLQHSTTPTAAPISQHSEV